MTITVTGTPAPQGSKKFMGIKGGRGILVESSKAVKPWREAVKWAALDTCVHTCRSGHEGPCISGAVLVDMTFTLPKPKSAKSGAHANKKPDLSKLVRSTEDALTDAGIWEDDSRVVYCCARKLYVGDANSIRTPGAVILIREAK